MQPLLLAELAVLFWCGKKNLVESLIDCTQGSCAGTGTDPSRCCNEPKVASADREQGLTISGVINMH